MNIAIRTDASTVMGTGHVMRCLTLAEALRTKGYRVSFVCRNLPGHINVKIIERQFELIQLENEALEHQQCIEIFSYLKPDMIIVDHYALDVRWESSMRFFCKHIMVIDDLANRIHDCDVLLDQNFQLTPARYQHLVPKNCKILSGTQYALLRPEFLTLRQQIMNKHFNQLSNIFVFLGGTDPENITQIIIEAITQSQFSGIVNVVLGKSNKYQSVLRKKFAHKKFIYIYSDIENIGKLMSSADLAIGAAGVNSWERCCLGLPSMIIKIAKNQEFVVKALVFHNAAHYLGNAKDITVESITTTINTFINQPALLEEMSLQAKQMVDGKGVERVVSILEKQTEIKTDEEL